MRKPPEIASWIFWRYKDWENYLENKRPNELVWVNLDRPIGSGDLWTTLELSKPRQMSGFPERMNKIENYETNIFCLRQPLQLKVGL